MGKFITHFSLLVSLFWAFSPAYGQDVGILGISAPVSGCALSASANVTVVIKNYSGAPQLSAFNASYVINAGSPVTESVSTIIGGNATLNFTFSTKANLSSPGSYAFKIYTSLGSDGNRSNDTLSGYIVTCDANTVGGTVSSSTNACSGNNSGTLTLDGETGSILNWESSTDGGSNWTPISNTVDTQSYFNITLTTLYRAVVKSGTCASSNSSTATITVDPSPAGGIISGITTVCAISNSGSLSLNGYTGNILNWESSTDGGANWTTIANTTTIQNYNNLTTTTLYRARAQMGNCYAYSSIASITVNPATVGGSISGSATECSGSNSGTFTLTGHTGSVVRWEYSGDGGGTWINISNTTNVQSYSNVVSPSRIYRVVVQSGTCPQANSSPATITLDEPSAGGSLNGSTSVCSGDNSGAITLNSYSGNILKWESSVDGGATWSAISNTTAIQNYLNLTVTTEYRTIVKSGVCSSDTSASALLDVSPLPNAQAGQDNTISLGFDITLNGTGGVSYSWSPSSGLSNSANAAPVASPDATITYTLTVTDANGCTASDAINLTVTRDYNFSVTNLITPNGDGKNDVWHIENAENYPLCQVSIFNIYGNELFTASPYENNWNGSHNGKELPDGTYYYIFKCPDSEKEFKGAITLLRNKQK